MTYYNRSAFLDMIAYSELGRQLLRESDNGYNVLVGSTPSHPLLFHSYDDHPNILNHALNSTAAGRYQLLHKYYVSYKNLLDLSDFSPVSQNAIAIQQIKECGALPLIDSGHIIEAIEKVCNIWASLPGNHYGQHMNKIDDLLAAYTQAGGSLS